MNKLKKIRIYRDKHQYIASQKYGGPGAGPEIFQRGVEGENFERKMFVDTRIKACTHKN